MMWSIVQHWQSAGGIKVPVWHQPQTRAPCHCWKSQKKIPQRREQVVNIICIIYVSPFILSREDIHITHHMDTLCAQVLSLPSSKKGGNSAPYWKLCSPLSWGWRIPSGTDNGLKIRKENTELNTVERQLWCSQAQCWHLYSLTYQ